jgi:hypothetical protein
VIGASASEPIGISFVLEQGKRTNRGTWVEPTVEACSAVVNPPSRKPVHRLKEFGGRTRIRTLDPLIKSQGARSRRVFGFLSPIDRSSSDGQH